ncbi:MAG TPA: geranylgeranyl reductase family protein [Acidimicrobiales bacterium]|nr:geranylgeranyl reductase family protein [Acidimicrobiales bacterium]
MDTGAPSRPGHRHDLLVIGGGPAGSAAAFWAAEHGLDVVFVERKRFPREKTCGDGLTPRAVKQLHDMGLAEQLTQFHRVTGLRAIAHGRTLELRWPEHPIYPDFGYVIRRAELDTFVAENAVRRGAVLLQHTEAITPILRNGMLLGATVRDHDADTVEEIHARYVVVADGSNSRFGRALGTWRDREYPQGMAIRGYFESARHDDPWIESVLDVRDRSGASLPGYGWNFPVGNGTINVGIGLLSTFRDWKSVNTSHLLREFAATLPDYWAIDPNNPIAPPTGGRLPMAGSVGPKVGPNWLIAGDAAGAINPFNGEGIDYAYETGRLAATLVAEALVTRDGLAIQRYPQILDDEFRLYFKVARLFAKVIGNPTLIRELTRVGMQSHTLMDWALRIMANLLRPDQLGPAEAAYKAIAALARLVPESAAATRS